jgi:hypothetical protein
MTNPYEGENGKSQLKRLNEALWKVTDPPGPVKENATPSS